MEDKKDIYCKFIYQCGICGTQYSTVLERAHCEIECTKKAEEAAKKAEEEKKAAEKAIRKEEVDKALENLHKLVSEYVADYGHYEYSDGGDDTNFYWPTRAWHRFW